MIQIKSNSGEELVIDTNKALGSGGFATVYKGKFKGEDVAVKKLQRKMAGNKTNSYYDQEVKISKEIQEICGEEKRKRDQNESFDRMIYNIVQIFEIIEERDTAYIIMELCQTDLRQYMKQKKDKMNLRYALNILEMIAQGIYVLHNKINIVHRDLKPENIFEFKGETTSWHKVADYGLGKSSDTLSTTIGTIQYMAPEMLDISCSSYDKKVDIWAMGVILHELITSVTLFNGRTQADIRNSILKFTSYTDLRNQALKNKQSISKTSLEKSLMQITDQNVINLINQMLQKDPKQRPNIEDILSEIERVDIILENNQKPTFPQTSEIQNSISITQSSNNDKMQQSQQPLLFGQQQQSQIQQQLQSQQQSQYQFQQSQTMQQSRFNMQQSGSNIQQWPQQQNLPIQFPQQIQMQGNLNNQGGSNILFNSQAESSQIVKLKKENEDLQLKNQQLQNNNNLLIQKQEQDKFDCLKKIDKYENQIFELEQRNLQNYFMNNKQISFDLLNRIFK